MQYGASCAQGEVIEQQFGEKELCFRTLDLYTSAVLEASLNPTTSPKPEWRGAMDLMSEVSNFSFGGQPACLLHCILHHHMACCNTSFRLVAIKAYGLSQHQIVAWPTAAAALRLLEALISDSMYSLHSGSHCAAPMSVDETILLMVCAWPLSQTNLPRLLSSGAVMY